MLLSKNVVPIHLPKSTARPVDSRFHKYSDHLPDRYLSQMTPFSTPLYDARVHVSRAKSHFKRKLHHLVQIFVRVDKNQNGLIPRTEVRWAPCSHARHAVPQLCRKPGGAHRSPAHDAHMRRRAAHPGEGLRGANAPMRCQCTVWPCALVPIY